MKEKEELESKNAIDGVAPDKNLGEVPPSADSISEKVDSRKWLATESAICFNFCSLVKKIKTHVKKASPRGTPEEVDIKVTLNLEVFTLNNQKFKYESFPNGLGGLRWYILCPKCGKKSLKLFLSKAPDREPLYLCKECHRLKPRSLIYCNRDKYIKIERPLSKLERIKKKLLKRGLDPKEANSLLAEYESIEKKLIESREYKIYKFKKEHDSRLP
jgi:hypothetical protein